MSQSTSDDLLKALLYDKSYTCPMCDKPFKAKAIRLGKNQLLSIDDDLYAHYALVNPLLYDILMCPNCGYSALVKTFDKLLPKQKEWLKDSLLTIHKQHTNFSEYPNTEEAIHKYKLALLIAINKKSKIGEQSYLALHIAWLYRDLNDTANEHLFLQKALTGFTEALETETLPILGFDEHTLIYLLSAIAYKLGHLELCKKHLSTLLVTPGISSRIKDRALDLKSKLKN